MLTIKVLTELLVQRFNQYAEKNDYSKELAIFENFATAEVDYKIQNTDEIVTAKQYGIIRNQNLQIGSVGGLQMVSGSLTVDVLVEISHESDEGQYPEVAELVNLINGFAAQYNKSYINAQADDGAYAIMPSFSAATVGFYSEDSSNWGAYVPVSFAMAFTALQNGTSSSSYRIKIDGEPIFCETIVLGRIKTSSSDVKSVDQNGVARVSDDSSAFEIEFAAPIQQNNSVCDALVKEMLDGSTNVPHLVDVIHLLGDSSEKHVGFFMMSFAKMQMTVASGSLVGINANLLEIDQDTADFGDSLDPWGMAFAYARDGKEASLYLEASGEYYIFWNDGTSERRIVTSPAQISHAYKQDGAYVVRYFRKA